MKDLNNLLLEFARRTNSHGMNGLDESANKFLVEELNKKYSVTLKNTDSSADNNKVKQSTTNEKPASKIEDMTEGKELYDMTEQEIYELIESKQKLDHDDIYEICEMFGSNYETHNNCGYRFDGEYKLHIHGHVFSITYERSNDGCKFTSGFTKCKEEVMIDYEDKAVPLVKEWWKKFEEAGLADVFKSANASVFTDNKAQEFIVYAYPSNNLHIDNTIIHTGIKVDIETYVDLKREE